MEMDPPNGSGRPLVLMGLDRWADNEVLLGNVELDALAFLLLLTFELLFDNLNLFDDKPVVFEGVPVSLFREETWLVVDISPFIETVVGVA